MSTYRYIFCDLLTNLVNIELPLYGAYFERIMGRAGNATFSMQLGNAQYEDNDIVNGTKAGRTKLFVERDNRLVWGGIVWSRTWQEQASTFQYTGQTPESFFFKQVIEETLTYSNLDQRNIAIRLINHMQAKTNANIGLIVPAEFFDDPEDTTIVRRTVQFPDYEGWTYGKALTYLMEYNDGLDLTIEPAWTELDEPGLYVRIDNELGQPPDSPTKPVFDFPGNISNFWFPENASMGAVSTLGFGKGEGTSMKRSKWVNPDLFWAGYPDIQQIYDNKDTSEQSTLDSQTIATGKANAIPVVTPTLMVDPTSELALNGWSLGDNIQVHIESRRFPDGYDLPTRAMGFTLRPAQDNDEEIKLIIPGQEEIGD